MVSTFHRRMAALEAALLAGVPVRCRECPPVAIFERDAGEPDPDPRCPACGAAAMAIVVIKPEEGVRRG